MSAFFDAVEEAEEHDAKQQRGILTLTLQCHSSADPGSSTKGFFMFGKKKKMRILMIGLDYAGKTTILHKLKCGEVVGQIPEIGYNIETLEGQNGKTKLFFSAWDVGGSTKIPALWRKYYKNTQGLIFVVDSSDVDREENGKTACSELHQMWGQDELRNVPLLVFANKQDLSNAMSMAELTVKLGLDSLSEDRQWHIQSCCALKEKGIHEGLDWLLEAMDT